MRPDDAFVPGSNAAAAQDAAKHAISGPLYTKLPGVGSQFAGIYVEGEVWREHFMSICSGNVQMVQEELPPVFDLCGFEKVFEIRWRDFSRSPRQTHTHSLLSLSLPLSLTRSPTELES